MSVYYPSGLDVTSGADLDFPRGSSAGVDGSVNSLTCTRDDEARHCSHSACLPINGNEVGALLTDATALRAGLNLHKLNFNHSSSELIWMPESTCL